MVVKKSDFLGTELPDEEEKRRRQVTFSELEERIDREIKQWYCFKKVIKVFPNGRVAKKIADEILETYRAAGWTITTRRHKEFGLYFRIVLPYE